MLNLNTSEKLEDAKQLLLNQQKKVQNLLGADGQNDAQQVNLTFKGIKTF